MSNVSSQSFVSNPSHLVKLVRSMHILHMHDIRDLLKGRPQGMWTEHFEQKIHSQKPNIALGSTPPPRMQSSPPGFLVESLYINLHLPLIRVGSRSNIAPTERRAPKGKLIFQTPLFQARTVSFMEVTACQWILNMTAWNRYLRLQDMAMLGIYLKFQGYRFTCLMFGTSSEHIFQMVI